MRAEEILIMKTPTQAHVQLLAGKVSAKDEAKAKANFARAEAAAKKRGVGAELLERLKLLWAMLTDPGYHTSWAVRAWIIAGLAYFVSPIDAIPDFVPVAGYLDDAAVISWVLYQLADEVNAYRRWKGLA